MAQQAQEPSGTVVNAQELQQLASGCRTGRPLLIDTRSARQFRRSHVSGSHHIPAGRLISSELPDGDLMLITEHPQQARQLIESLHTAGYVRRLQYLEGGLAAWRRLQLPLEGEASSQQRWASGPLQRWGTPVLLAAGFVLIALAGLSESLPLLALGMVLLAGAGIEAGLAERVPTRRLELDG